MLMGSVDNSARLEMQAYLLIEEVADLPRAKQYRALLSECKGDDSLFEKCIDLLDYQTSDTQFIGMIYADQKCQHGNFDYLEKQIGDYELIKKIGSGGTAEVFLAIRKGDICRTPIALKLMHRREHTHELTERFKREQTILAQFEHPNIAKFISGGTTDDGRSFFLMEFVQGKPVTQYCKENKLPLNARLELFLRVCSAVSAAHRSSTLHRDLKPSNILVSKEGIPKLLDFGIAKVINTSHSEHLALTEFFSPMTPQYASPEQIKQQTLCFASDQYSLGVLLYELITDELPFHSIENKLMHVTCGEKIVKPSERIANRYGKQKGKRQGSTTEMIRALDSIVLKSTHHHPEKRYDSVAMLAADIERYLCKKSTLTQNVHVVNSVTDMLGLSTLN